MDLVAREDWDIFLRTMTATRRSPSAAKASMERLRQMVTQQDFVKKFHAYQASDISDLCRRIRAPALVLHTRQIDRPSLRESAELAAQFREGRLAEIGGGLPPWMWGDYDSAIPIIEDFLASIPSGAAGAAPSEETHDHLSHREFEVLRLLAAGKSNQQIADELVISVNTVNRHVSNIFDKIGVANRTEASLYARDQGLV
jgi:DNA-binding CsgD family transcriptional regulator